MHALQAVGHTTVKVKIGNHEATSFMSKKFTNMQCSYFTYEHETLGLIEALKKWDNELLGLPEIWIISDHEALKQSC
jgi:hypothetical protein